MHRLKACIENHSKWKDLEVYIDRIETYKSSDFSMSLENSKALLESIAKQICKDKNIDLNDLCNEREREPSFNKLLKASFEAIGYEKTSTLSQISGAVSNIAQKIGELRNESGSNSHGKPLEEIRKRNSQFDEFTVDFLFDTTDIISSLLIRSMENKNPSYMKEAKGKMLFTHDQEFNDSLDEIWGEIEIGEETYPASEILYNLGYENYEAEYKAHIEGLENESN